jgi:hypothetical protein
MKVRKSWGEVTDTLLWGGRKSIDCEKVPRVCPLVLPVRVRVKGKALEWLEAVAWERARGALISELVFTYIILVILTARKRNFDEFKSGGLHEKHAVANWNLGTISLFAYMTEKPQENLCRDGRSQDLPDTHWLIASGPANRTVGRFPNVFLGCVLIALLLTLFTRHVHVKNSNTLVRDNLDTSRNNTKQIVKLNLRPLPWQSSAHQLGSHRILPGV